MNWTRVWQWLFSDMVSPSLPTSSELLSWTAQAWPSSVKELWELLAKQGRRKGGTGKRTREFKLGLLELASTFPNADAVAADANLANGGTLIASSFVAGTSRKQSLKDNPTTVVDFWSPTSATIAGSGDHLVLPRSVMWWRAKGFPSEAIPTNRMASSPSRLSMGIEVRRKRPPRSDGDLLVSSAPSWLKRYSAQEEKTMAESIVCASKTPASAGNLQGFSRGTVGLFQAKSFYA